jgi:hypothetical protein
LRYTGYELRSVRKTSGDDSRLCVMHIATLLGFELKQLNKKLAEMFLYVCQAAFPRLVRSTNMQAIYNCIKNHVYNCHTVSMIVLLGKYSYCAPRDKCLAGYCHSIPIEPPNSVANHEVKAPDARTGGPH